MQAEAIAALDVQTDPGRVYVDGTGGGGTHSRLILDRLDPSSRLIIIDRDIDAIEHLNRRFAGIDNVTIVNDVFFNFDDIMDRCGVDRVDGCLLDLGLSTHQILSDRGFSFRHADRLDMRMSADGDLSAYEVVNSYSFEELKRVFYEYGEERFAPQIAREIVRRRQEKPIERTDELSSLVEDVIPAKFKRNRNAATAVFQSIRIEVNGELSELPDALNAMVKRLRVNGTLAVITFHSLEAAVTKRTLSQYTSAKCTCPREFPRCVCGAKRIAKFTNRSLAPTEAEIHENPASRSARIWSIRKIEEI